MKRHTPTHPFVPSIKRGWGCVRKVFTNETYMSNIDINGNENVIPAPDNEIRGQAPAGIQRNEKPLKQLDSRLHGNDGLEVFTDEDYK